MHMLPLLIDALAHHKLSYLCIITRAILLNQTRRRGSGVFAGKQGFITLRDLFRWAERYRRASYETKDRFFDWDQQLADNGKYAFK